MAAKKLQPQPVPMKAKKESVPLSMIRKLGGFIYTKDDKIRS